ncbi:MAG: polyphosphate kinase 1 [Tissierellia bacterium]|nr:polyphosphate kinase 1 [Tissierellia bacterium]
MSSYMQNRELSWLKFNERVLEKGGLKRLPLYERLKFNSIFESNLTEFFMVRVGSLTDLTLLDTISIDDKTGMTAQDQLDAIFKDLVPLYAMRDQIFSDLEREMRKAGISNLKYHELNVEEKNYIDSFYEKEIKPLLSPNVIYKMHPFPFMENQQIHVIAELDDNGKTCYLLLPLRDNLPAFKKLPNSNNYILLGEIVINFIEELVPNYKVLDRFLARVTRNADIDLEKGDDDYDEDYRKYVKKILKNRRILAPVRLEIDKAMSSKTEKFMLKNLELEKNQVFVTKAPLDMAYVWDLPKINQEAFEEISHSKFTPSMTRMLDHKKPLIPQVEHHDVLMAYPFESMDPFIRLLKEASVDPRVFSIKITIYRLAAKSQLIKYLLRACEEGKEVTVIMELRARFDEANNIDYSEELIAGGVNVMYGIENYKVHSKVCLISYRDQGQTKYITHIGTGNYNESTAKLYQDFNLITSHHGIGLDASNFFNNLQINKIDNEYKYLIQSPSTLRTGIIDLIDREIAKGDKGYIRLKCNSVTDKKIIEKISEASKAGVKVDMIVRGICCLIPGIEKKTENVRVISIVGRYLEHARIYQFGKGDRMDLYIASADLMTRNTKKRVEIGAPILNSDLRRFILEYLDNQFKDTVNAKELRSDGKYHTIDLDEDFDSHRFQMYYDPDYLVRVFLGDQEVSEEKSQAQVEDIKPKEEDKKEGFFKRLWKKLFG